MKILSQRVRMSHSRSQSINLFFDKELCEILSAEEVVFTQLCVNQYFGDELCSNNIADTSISYYDEFIESSSYWKLFEHYMFEMPYGVAKARTGDPDLWILDKLKEKQYK